MRRVLIVAYLFPPLGGGGVQRTLSFVRHLPSLGWRPTVVCADAGVPYWARDETLLARIPAEAEVVRVSDGGLQRLLLAPRRILPSAYREVWPRLLELPDRQVVWLPAALAAVRRALARARFEVMYTTSTPFTDHLVALALGPRRPPWVADFRDPWTDNRTFRPLTPVHRALAHAGELRVIEQASAIVANTPPNAAALRRRFPDAGHRISAIPNGWEPSDFDRLPAPERPPPLTIAYTGSFYPGYGPEAFFHFLRGAFEIQPPLRRQVRLRFAGKTDLGPLIEQYGLGDMASEAGYLSQDESLALLSRSTLQLLVLPPGAEGWVPQKLYVGLRVNHPFVAVCPPGEARRILTEAGGASLILDPGAGDGAPRLAEWLTERLRESAAGRRPPPFDAEVVARFDRSRLARRLADLFDRTAETSTG